MSDKPRFKPELLKQPAEVRQQWFDDRRIKHKRLEEASAQVIKPIRARAGGELVNVVGPTGVGKTTLMEHAMAELIKLVMPEVEKDPGFIPTAFITCQGPTSGVYDWIEHFTRILLALGEVLIDRKIYLPEPGPLPDEVKALVTERFGKVRPLRSAAESAIRHRKLRALFADEAQNILKGSSADRLVSVADAVRSTASASTLLILLGHYDLLELVNLNGQLGRRSRTVHFTRYYINRKEDREEFTKVFRTLQALMPLPTCPQLDGHLDFAFERTIGCVGRLKNWLSRCLDTALTNGCDTVTYDMFEADADRISVCRQAAIETSEGEFRLKEHEDEQAADELRLLLKEGEMLMVPDGDKPNYLVRQTAGAAPDGEPPKAGGKKQPGKKIETSPRRYVTGGKSDGN